MPVRLNSGRSLTSTTPSVHGKPGKNLIFEYKPDANNTHRPSMRAYWSLNSIGESGLAARLEVDPYTSGLKSILFPNMIGMGYDQNCIDTQGTAASCYSASVPSHASGVTQPLYKVISGTYQNSSLSAQFSSLNDDQYTLYIGSHDPAGFPKKYRFEAISRNRPTGIEHYLRNNNEITEADSFNVVVRPMCGNWQKSAKLYRRWATQHFIFSASEYKVSKNKKNIYQSENSIPFGSNSSPILSRYPNTVGSGIYSKYFWDNLFFVMRSG